MMRSSSLLMVNAGLIALARNEQIYRTGCRQLRHWIQMLALDGAARAWEPKRLRLRLFSAAGRLARGGRRLRLRLAAAWPWANQITAAITRLQALPSG